MRDRKEIFTYNKTSLGPDPIAIRLGFIRYFLVLSIIFKQKYSFVNSACSFATDTTKWAIDVRQIKDDSNDNHKS